MAELIDACEAGHDHDADPVQVRPCTQVSISTSAMYSRLRAIDPNSSFSVMG